MCVYVPRVVNVHVVQVECPHIRVVLRKHLAGDEGCTAHKVQFLVDDGTCTTTPGLREIADVLPVVGCCVVPCF